MILVTIAQIVRATVLRGMVNVMIRIKKNKPLISADTKSFRIIRRLHLNRTYMPIKIGAVVGYLILGMLSASTSMFGILIGAMLRIAGF
jgi:endonuclease III